MNIVITGGTGLIGRHLIPRLLELGHQITVVTRNPQKASSVLGPRVTLWQGLADQSNLNGVDAVINLAGEPIADKRDVYKRQVYSVFTWRRGIWYGRRGRRLCHYHRTANGPAGL